MTNDRLKALWFIHLRQKNLSESTITNYRKHLKTFDRWIKDKSYLEMTQDHIQDFFSFQKSKAQSTRNVLTAVLMGYYGFLHERGHMIRDARGWFPKFDNARKILDNVPTVKQIRQLILSPDMNTSKGYMERTMIIIQYSGGLRASELLGLDIDDVDHIRQTITITRKGGATQELPVGELAFEYLTTYLDGIRSRLTPKGSHVWVNEWGKRLTYTNYQQMVKKYWRRLEEEGFSTHSLRHGCGTHMLNGGASLHSISVFLGHRNINSTEIYTKVEPRQIRDVVDSLSFN